MEVKSGQTLADDFFDALDNLAGLIPSGDIASLLAYGCDSSQRRAPASVVSWRDPQRVDWKAGTLSRAPDKESGSGRGEARARRGK